MGSFKILVIYQTTWCHIPEDRVLVFVAMSISVRSCKDKELLTLQRGATSTARPSENVTCRGVTSTARRAALSHSFDYISTT